MLAGLRSRARRVAPLTCWVLTLGAARPASAEEPAEWMRDAPPEVFYLSPTNTAGVPTHVVIRVVDHATGEPIRAASAALYAQSDRPITGLVPPDRIGFADEDGWIRIRADDLGWTPTWTMGYWKYVEAPGHAGVAVHPGDNEGEVRLSRARRATVEVRDVLDHPLSNVTIGWRVSSTCGHMPDQRLVVTGLDGRADVPDVAPSEGQEFAFGWECWAVHPSIESDYHELEFSRHAGPAQILRHAPSYAIEGTILDADGKPVAQAWVGGNGAHRGPWARTDSSGRFSLFGARLRNPWLSVETPDWPTGSGAPELPSFLAPPAGVHRTFRLPRKAKVAPDPATHPVTLRVRNAATHEEIDDEERVRLIAVREADGWTADPTQPITSLPSGAWTLHVGGGASPWARARLHVEVPDAMDAPPVALVVDAERNPAIRFRFAGNPLDANVELVTESEARTVTTNELNARSISVPADGECAFRVGYRAAESSTVARWLYTPISAEARHAGAEPIRIALPAPMTIVAKLAGPDGKTVLGWLAADVARLVDDTEFADWEPEASPRLSPELSVYAEGSIDLLAIPENRTLAPRVVTVALPPGSIEGGWLDAGIVRLEPRGDTSLHVLLPDDKPAEYTELRVVRAGAVRTWHPREAPTVFDPPLTPLAEGDVVEVVGASWGKAYLPPIRRRLEGPGPWTIRNDLPDTSILVDPEDEDGKPIVAMLVIDGKPLRTEAYTDEHATRHPFEVAGLTPGPHRIAICARDHVTRLCRVVLEAHEHRTIPARLRVQAPSPAPPTDTPSTMPKDPTPVVPTKPVDATK